MIHVAIACAGSGSTPGRYCPPLEGTVAVADVERWHVETVAKHAWTVDESGDAYCSRHNPADRGAPVELTSEEYLPLGTSGWEARVPRNPNFDVSFASIEIRQRRGGDGEGDDPEPRGDGYGTYHYRITPTGGSTDG